MSMFQQIIFNSFNSEIPVETELNLLKRTAVYVYIQKCQTFNSFNEFNSFSRIMSATIIFIKICDLNIFEAISSLLKNVGKDVYF